VLPRGAPRPAARVTKLPSPPAISRAVACAALLLAFAACAGEASAPGDPSPPAPTETPAVGAAATDVCVDLRHAGRVLRELRAGSLNGEELVDGLGDTAAQLKGDVRALRASGSLAASSLVDDLARTLTRMRESAQDVELSEGGAQASGREADEGSAAGSIERRLHQARRQLRAIRTRLADECAGGGG
jgi:hypothetical protein